MSYYASAIIENVPNVNWEENSLFTRTKSLSYNQANNIDRMMIRTGYSLEHLDSPDVVIQNTTECLQPTTGTVYILQNTVVHNKQLALTGRSGIMALRIGCCSLHHMNRFLLDSIMDLEVVQIGNNVFQSPTTSNSTISITNCPKLVSIEIGSMSFLSLGSISITHCPLLSSLAIGSQSFPEYNAFELTDLPSLQSIHIGSNSFSALPTFNLRKLPHLTSLTVDSNSFYDTNAVILQGKYT